MISICTVGDILSVAGGMIRCGGRPAVHLVDENDRQMPRGSHVHGLVEGASVGCSVSEEDYRDLIVLQNRLVGKRRTGGQVVSAAHDAVGSQHTNGEIRDMHGAAAALAQAGLLTKNLSHHPVHIGTLSNAVAMTAVRGLDHIVLPQSSAYAGSNSLLTDVQMYEAGDLTGQRVVLDALLEMADH